MELLVGSFSRLVPYVWPHRGKVLLSTVFGLVVAVLWGTNLSIAFPIVKVLLQGQSIEQYVDEEIKWHENEIATRTAAVQQIGIERVRQHARQQAKLADLGGSLGRLRWIRSHIVPQLPSDAFDTVALILGILLVGTLLKGAAIYIQDVLIGSAVELSIRGVREACFGHCLELDYQSLCADGSARLMARFTNDMNIMADGLKLLGGKIIREPMKAVCCIVLATMINWQLTLLAMIFVPVFALVFSRYGRVLKQGSHRMMESMTRIYEALEETFHALKVVIAFNGAEQQRQRFSNENREYYRRAMSVVKLQALTNPTTELLGLAAICLALLPGAYLVLRGTTEIWNIRLASNVMDEAQLAVLYVLLAGTIDPIRKLSAIYTRLKRSSAAAERIFELLDRESQIRPPKLPQRLGRMQRSIEFANVSFSYDGNDVEHPEALAGVNLVVEAGEVVALVGGNGSGKSTLVNLLPRLLDPTDGAVLVDDIDLRDVDPVELRRQIGLVTQETLLFNDTILENIRFGRPEATREEVITAARQALVCDFVDQFPNGFDTSAGQKGQRLSGGQRQRVALARAILRDPAILILDEATSAVDAAGEEKIHRVLSQFVRGRTVLLITHSLSPHLLDLVTRIVVMDRGQIIASGPHVELLKSCPSYRQAFYLGVEGNNDAAA